MPEGLEIALAPERLDEGSPEERAAFGLFTIRTGHASLTEGFDCYLNGFRQGPLVSGYHAAEWFAWNWWRLRWEPRAAYPDWDFAHRMTSIGQGYAWPNLSVFSDGERTALISRPSSTPDARPFRYVGGLPTVVPSTLFEAAIDAFLPQIIGRLREEGVAETNLDGLWADLLTERDDADLARRRRLEALLGRDPDAVEDDLVERMLADAVRLGESALDEVAADQAQRGGHAEAMLTAEAFDRVAALVGSDSSPRDAVRLHGVGRLPKRAEAPAWKFGADAAVGLRAQERLGHNPVSDDRLAQMAGTRVAAIADPPRAFTAMSFELDSGPTHGRIVLRSNWQTGRRFDLARLLGDRLFGQGPALYPATRAHTYRQKAQRSFAAELLSPFEEVDAMLNGDFSAERQEDAAERFNVSPMTIETLLKNHGRLERDLPEDDAEGLAA